MSWSTPGTPAPYGAASGAPSTRPTPQQPARRGGLRAGFQCAGFFIVLIWGVHILNVLTGGSLHSLGVRPLDVSSLWHILTAPLVHGDLGHLLSNTPPAAIFAFLIGCSGRRVFWEVTAIATVIGGLGVWFFGGIGTTHLGASILVYGWLAYLVVRGVFNRSLGQIALGITLGMAYSGYIWGVLPWQPGVSWQGHLFGGVGGVLAGMWITSDDPVRRRSLSS